MANFSVQFAFPLAVNICSSNFNDIAYLKIGKAMSVTTNLSKGVERKLLEVSRRFGHMRLVFVPASLWPEQVVVFGYLVSCNLCVPVGDVNSVPND